MEQETTLPKHLSQHDRYLSMGGLERAGFISGRIRGINKNIITIEAAIFSNVNKI